jgi:hypothetical protein
VAAIAGDPIVAILALAPSPLIGPSLARLVAAREETVGALLTGTIVLSFPLLLAAIPGMGPDRQRRALRVRHRRRARGRGAGPP